jgi:serine/threonine protein kinase
VLQKGDVLGGRYELVEKLGEGGMGTVWIARNTALGGAEVAVKVMHPNLAEEKTSVERFRNEAQIAGRIGHPNIVRVFDFGESSDGAPYMIMERLHGESLGAKLEREGSLRGREAVTLLCQILEALAAAHDKEVLHRDLKPENIFLTREGNAVVPKILDFGVSKILGDDARRTKMTRTGSIIGTPAYMSPEQVMGTLVDLRADLWAMGVILYELVTGTLPFDAPNYNAVLVRIATSPPDSPVKYVPDLDPGLVEIIERAMARKVSDRFASAIQMRESLEQWLRGEAITIVPGVPRAATNPDRSTPLAFENGDTVRDLTFVPSRSSSRWVVLGVVATVCLSVGLVLYNPFARDTSRSATLPHPVVLTPRHALRIEGLPPAAHVYVDDQPTMLPTRISADTNHSVRVTVAGYRDWMQVVSQPASDVSLAYTGVLIPEVQPDVPQAAPARRDAREATTHRTSTVRVHHSAESLVGGELP